MVKPSLNAGSRTYAYDLLVARVTVVPTQLLSRVLNLGNYHTWVSEATYVLSQL